MSDERLTDEKLDYMIYVLEQHEGVAVPQSEVLAVLRELKAARKEIARWEALPPRMVPGVIRPVYPINESDYPIDERGEN